MNEFTIYCTKEQTKKAFKLGAPLITKWFPEYWLAIITKPKVKINNDWFSLEIPTTEQMIGFLRSKGFRFKIDELSDTITAYRVTFGYWYKVGQSSNPKGATFAVIDAALEYLIKRSL